MASDLLTIAASGARAARGALDVTAQNIANASTEGYVRRTLGTTELSASSGLLRPADIAFSGVRITGVNRNADIFRQAEVRRTGADATRSTALLHGLENIESAIEQARPYERIVAFEASLRALTGNPADPSLRAATIAAADGMAGAFNVAATSLDAVGDALRFEAQGGVEEANLYGAELARLNLRLARAASGSGNRATLLDQRDLLLEKLSGQADITTSFATDGSVTVRLGGNGGPIFVQGDASATLGMATQADGTIAFAVNGSAVALKGGALSGKAEALEALADAHQQLDTLAGDIANTVNLAQAAGTASDGSAGQPLFTGSTAASLGLAFSDGAGLATAPAGAPAGSTNPSNLNALRAAFDSAGYASAANALLFDISSDVAARRVTSEAFTAIALSARAALDQQSGVDLDQEAANLMRFQQAFQASGRAMQVASDIFDTLIGIGR